MFEERRMTLGAGLDAVRAQRERRRRDGREGRNATPAHAIQPMTRRNQCSYERFKAADFSCAGAQSLVDRAARAGRGARTGGRTSRRDMVPGGLARAHHSWKWHHGGKPERPPPPAIRVHRLGSRGPVRDRRQGQQGPVAEKGAEQISRVKLRGGAVTQSSAVRAASPAGVARVGGGVAFVTSGTDAPDAPLTGLRRSYFGYEGGTPQPLADLLAYELANNPDGQLQFDPVTARAARRALQPVRAWIKARGTAVRARRRRRRQRRARGLAIRRGQRVLRAAGRQRRGVRGRAEQRSASTPAAIRCRPGSPTGRTTRST